MRGGREETKLLPASLAKSLVGLGIRTTTASTSDQFNPAIRLQKVIIGEKKYISYRYMYSKEKTGVGTKGDRDQCFWGEKMRQQKKKKSKGQMFFCAATVLKIWPSRGFATHPTPPSPPGYMHWTKSLPPPPNEMHDV